MNNKKTNDNITAKVVKKHRKISVILAILLVLCIAVIAVVGVAFSWFSPADSSSEVDARVTPLTAKMQYRIGTEGEYGFLNDSVYFGFVAGESIPLQLRVQYLEDSDAYIRVALFASFVNSADGTLIPASEVSYELASSGWSYNDGYYYYSDIVKGTSTDTIDFVTSLTVHNDTNVTYDSNSAIKLVAVIEAVQPDRYDEMFGDVTELLYAVDSNIYKKLTNNDRFDISTIDGFKASVKYAGAEQPCYIRVRLSESFVSEDGSSIDDVDYSFTLEDGWVYNNGYYYYKYALDESIVIPLINDSAFSYTDGVTVYMSVDPLIEPASVDAFEQTYGITYESIFGDD